MAESENKRHWTVPRAILVTLFKKVQDAFGGEITHLSMQKLVYFLQLADVDYKVRFVNTSFGPFSEELAGHFKTLNTKGYFQGFENVDSDSNRSITMPEDSFAEAFVFLRRQKNSKVIGKTVEGIESLIQGYESPLGLRLLSTVHWHVMELYTTSPDKVTDSLGKTTTTFKPSYIVRAIERLKKGNFVL